MAAESMVVVRNTKTHVAPGGNASKPVGYWRSAVVLALAIPRSVFEILSPHHTVYGVVERSTVNKYRVWFLSSAPVKNCT
ncbi:hypothetical protein KCP73_17910 [Salmonella enterica subsp. enterica]|nr:hypothetical protein KCP73_17910 [Salmonella enterica subsp. enterica]